jgi:tricorn protease
MNSSITQHVTARIVVGALLAGFAAGFATSAAAEPARLLRFPTLSDSHIAFAYANDIWIVPRAGGVAERVTSHEGQEWFPRFSPDGKWIAFTGDYDGNRDVYVVAASGGEPKRLTWSPDIGGDLPERMGPDNVTLGWTPDGKIVYRSRREQWNAFNGRPWVVSPSGDAPAEPMPIPYSGCLSVSPDGKKVAYNDTWREFRTWKRYKGGMAQDVFIYDLAARTQTRITDSDAVDDFPMWAPNNTIYFVSERDKRANIFAYDLGSQATRKLTTFDEYDVKFPSLGPGAIVFEMGGWIHTYDLASGNVTRIDIEVPSDKTLARPRYVDVSDDVDEFTVAPDGKRAAFVARGEIFTVPAEHGDPRNITQSSGARERRLQWSPDGRMIAYISDESGEQELYVRAQDGNAKAVRLTTDGHCVRFQPIWSPDSKKLAFSDSELHLYWVDVASKKVTLVDQGHYWEINDYSWSPDSRWLAYAKAGENMFQSIYICDTNGGKVTQVTPGFTQDHEPVFDPDGKYLYFLSDRDWSPTFMGYESNFYYGRRTRPYALTLRADIESPFAPRSDETEIEGEDEKGAKDKKDEDKGDDKDDEKENGKDGKASKSKKPAAVKIDLDGLGERIAPFDVSPGNYRRLGAVSGKVLWISAPEGGGDDDGEPEGGGGGGGASLRIYDMKDREEKEVAKPVGNYEIAARGEKMIVATRGDYAIIDIAPKQELEEKVDTSELEMMLDPRAEWAQILADAWRLERDYFYAKNMHGVDWPAVRAKYEALLPHVAHRTDLTYLIGEMVGELGVGHSYTGGGDAPKAKRVQIGLLGAELTPGENDRYRITRIFEGQNWMRSRRSPLTEPGLNVKTGDYILAINGNELRAPTDPGSLLLNSAGKQTTLRVNSRPSDSGARDIVVVPVAHDAGLRYYNWVEKNRRYVEERSGGRVGYIHIPNMGAEGLNEFARTYYPQVRKEALILDDRWNGGGFVSEMIHERLNRKLSSLSAARNKADFTYPDATHYGPKVCLLNQWSASDGDYFPYHFRRFGTGKIIGRRSWGGVVGIRGGGDLVDGGFVTMPEFAAYSPDGEWIIENRGVDPDIEVVNEPGDWLAGKDAQLDAAIDLMMKEIEGKSFKLPKRPADPSDR